MNKLKFLFTLFAVLLFTSLNLYADNGQSWDGGKNVPLNVNKPIRPGRTSVQETIYCYVSQNAIEFELPADVEFAYLTIGDATCPILTDIVYQDDNVVVIPTLVSDCAITLTTDAGTEYYGFIQVD